jgi:hypothetical protein
MVFSRHASKLVFSLIAGPPQYKIGRTNFSIIISSPPKFIKVVAPHECPMTKWAAFRNNYRSIPIPLHLHLPLPFSPSPEVMILVIPYPLLFSYLLQKEKNIMNYVINIKKFNKPIATLLIIFRSGNCIENSPRLFLKQVIYEL